MNVYGASSSERREVGIGAAQHVYGPASVHLLPCKIHHTGPAPVATYFRPKQSPSLSQPLAEGDPNAALTTAVGAAGAASTAGFGCQSLTNDETSKSEEVVEPCVDEAAGGAGGAEGTEGAERAEGAEGTQGPGVGEQKWDIFDDDEDDSAEFTARFRGRKLIGRKVELPEGVNGVVLRSKPCPEAVREENEDVTSFWAAETSFSSVTVWGHDQVRRESTMDRGLAWLKVSNSIHDP